MNFKQFLILIFYLISLPLVAQETEVSQIRDLLIKESEAYHKGDVASWKSTWNLNGDISYLITIDGQIINTVDSLNKFISAKLQKRTIVNAPELEITDLNCIIKGGQAYVTFIKTQKRANSDINSFESEQKSFETRSLTKVGNQWKIYTAMSSSFYHESSLPMVELFLGRSAWILFENGKINESIEVANAYIKTFPESISGFSTLAYLYLENNDVEKALTALEKALEINPQEMNIKRWYEQLKNSKK